MLSSATTKYNSLSYRLVKLYELGNTHFTNFQNRSPYREACNTNTKTLLKELEPSYRKKYLTDAAEEINKLRKLVDDALHRHNVSSLADVNDPKIASTLERTYSIYLKVKSNIESHLMPVFNFNLADPDYVGYKNSIAQLKQLQQEIFSQDPSLENKYFESIKTGEDPVILDDVTHDYIGLLKGIKLIEDTFADIVKIVESVPSLISNLNKNLTDFLEKSLSKKYIEECDKIGIKLKHIDGANRLFKMPPSVNPEFTDNINRSSSSQVIQSLNKHDKATQDEKFFGSQEAIINSIYDNELKIMMNLIKDQIIATKPYKDYLKLHLGVLMQRFESYDKEYSNLDYHINTWSINLNSLTPEEINDLKKARARKAHLNSERYILLSEYNDSKNQLWELYNIWHMELPEYSIYHSICDTTEEKTMVNQNDLSLKPTIMTIDKYGNPNQKGMGIKSIDERTSDEDKRMLAAKTVESYVNQNHKKRVYVSGKNEELVNLMKGYCDAMKKLVEDPYEKVKYERYPDEKLTFSQRRKIANATKVMETFIKEKGIDVLRGKQYDQPGLFSSQQQSINTESKQYHNQKSTQPAHQNAVKASSAEQKMFKNEKPSKELLIQRAEELKEAYSKGCAEEKHLWNMEDLHMKNPSTFPVLSRYHERELIVADRNIAIKQNQANFEEYQQIQSQLIEHFHYKMPAISSVNKSDSVCCLVM